MTRRVEIHVGQHWQFTTAAGEVREYVVEHIADHAERPGRRVTLTRLGGGEDVDKPPRASVFEGWLREGRRSPSGGCWEPLGEGVAS